jgi:hypothetical protein
MGWFAAATFNKLQSFSILPDCPFFSRILCEILQMWPSSVNSNREITCARVESSWIGKFVMIANSEILQSFAAWVELAACQQISLDRTR